MTELKYKRFERVLCGIDFSEFSFWAYDQALAVAERYQARFFVHHVVEEWRYPINYSRITPDRYAEYCERLVREARQQLQDFVKTYPNDGVQTPSECLADFGNGADRILSLAKERSADLIVMGTHGRRGFNRLIMGSVTERVLRNAPCPVLSGHLSASDFEAARYETAETSNG